MGHVARVGELIFDSPSVERSWKEVLFSGIEKRFHPERQADVLLRIARLQETLRSATSMSIHRMGRGRWALFQFNTTYREFKRATRLIGIKGFESHECNQVLADFAETKTAKFISDIEVAKGVERERLLLAGHYLSDLMNLDGAGLLTCRADKQTSKRIIRNIEENEALVFRGDITPHDALVKTMKFRKRLVRASLRRHAA